MLYAFFLYLKEAASRKWINLASPQLLVCLHNRCVPDHILLYLIFRVHACAKCEKYAKPLCHICTFKCAKVECAMTKVKDEEEEAVIKKRKKPFLFQ